MVASPAQAQAQASSQPGVLSGIVSTQAGTVRLPGATVTISSGRDAVGETVLSDESGHFTQSLAPGEYTVTAALPGFVTTSVVVRVVAGAQVAAAIDLPIETVAQRVDVVARDPIATSEGTIAPTETIGGKELDQFAPTGGLQASLRLLASIIEVPGGVSIKGGRPNQSSVQLGSSSLVDPATGLAQFALPDDAIDSVAVLPNPYAVEYGRFSSGLVVIQTRRAGDEWKIRLNSPDPTFRSTRTNPFDLVGIGWWGPRLEVGGPVIKNRLFLEQAAQFRYSASDVPSRPIDELRTSQSFSSFTRLDGIMTPRHSFVATVAFVPGVADQATLGTFTPPPATVDLHSQANETAFTERAIWTDTLLTETTVQMHDYRTDVVPQGAALMELRPETTLGNFFDQQSRETDTLQLISSLSGTRSALGGLHLYKVGIDLMRSAYDAADVSRDIAIEAPDGTPVRRFDFPGVAGLQHVASTDVALFAQDRFQPGARWYTEFGFRIDRDGITERFNTTPRVGAAWLLNESGSSVLRGGFGLFYERTPSTAGAFDQFVPYVDTRYASDGMTPLSDQLVLYRSHPNLQTPRSRTWDASYEQRLSKNWSMHVAAIDRDGSHELIVNPVQEAPALQAMTLASNGHSQYRGAEVGVRAAYGQRGDLNVSYARASARADLNSLTTYFDAVRVPVIGENQYAAANADVPNRLFARGRLMPTDRWLLLGIFDWRTGLPYSVVNAPLDFVGPRNSLRFPTYQRLEVGVERRFTVLKFQPWIGVRVWNALNSFLPTDVQNNISSPAFGSLYNSEYRQFRIQIRFER
jgi:hypothetical protein